MFIIKKIFFVYLCLCAIQVLEGAEFHAILVGDTSDKTLLSGVEANLTQMQALVTKMAHASELKLNLMIFKGKKNLPQKIKQHIDSLQVAPNDVVFFYQSSHGLRPSSHEGRWPFLYYGNEQVAVCFESIHRYLWSKQPRFLLSIADVCNNVVENPMHDPEESVEALVTRAKKSSKKAAIATACFKKLWLKSKGSLIVSSSEPFQVSFCIVTDSPLFRQGGFFTLSFIKALNAAANGRLDGSWEAILNRAKRLTERLAQSTGEEQTPQFAWMVDPVPTP